MQADPCHATALTQQALTAYITPEYEEVARVSVCPFNIVTGAWLLLGLTFSTCFCVEVVQLLAMEQDRVWALGACACWVVCKACIASR